MSAVLQSSVAANRKAFYDKIDKANVTPLWEVLHNLITATPSTNIAGVTSSMERNGSTCRCEKRA